MTDVTGPGWWWRHYSTGWQVEHVVERVNGDLAYRYGLVREDSAVDWGPQIQEPPEPPAPEPEIVETLAVDLSEMTDDQRLEWLQVSFKKLYCQFCGGKHPPGRCQCENDI